MGSGDYTAASHLTLIVALLIGARRMLRLSSDLRVGRVSLASAPSLPVASFMMLAAIALERLYYFSARVLSPEFNLWEWHPAPQVLSLSVAIFVINESHASLKRRGLLPELVMRARLIDAGLLAGSWVVGFTASWVI